MKTKEVIKQLQDADPTGEEECCVDNVDIHFVTMEPAYLDGCLQVLRRDESNPFYNIIGADFVANGVKIVISTLSIDDVILNDPETPIGYIGLSSDMEVRYMEHVEKERNKIRDMKNEIGLEYFTKFIKKQIPKAIESDDIIKEFYKNNISYNDPMPQEITKQVTKVNEEGWTEVGSWNQPVNLQWASLFNIYVENGKLNITRKFS